MIQDAWPLLADDALRPPAEPGLVVGTLLARLDEGAVLLDLGAGPVAGRRAFSCLVEPIAGDRVLVARSLQGLHLLAILDRPTADGAKLDLPGGGALTLSAVDLRLSARRQAVIEAPSVTFRGAGLTVVADTITLLGRLATLVADTIRLSSKTQELSADTMASKSLDRVTIVERTDVLRAGRLIQTIEETAVTTAPIAVIATGEDLRLDGKRVTVG